MERIAAALDVTMGQVFDGAGPESPLPAVVRAGDRVTLTSEWSKAQIESLATAGTGARLEPVLLILAPGGKSGTRPYSSEREEFALILEGTVVLTLKEPGSGGTPEQEYVLQSGDAVMIRAGVARRWENSSRAPVKVMMVSAR
ncbi:MAG: cupin domain-containing protein [Gemmatimonadales bacterium]|nr:cupin domain-containing protein [Gemmatimonadales bacterium]